jgi:predicted ribosome quality control (RQC) complex YloA/Tae2 family protein
MSMVWDAPLVAATASALRNRLENARLRAFHLEYDARRLRLHFREATLVFHLHVNELGLLYAEPTEPADDARPLASHLQTVLAPTDDRVLVFQLRRVRGRPAAAAVVVELLGNQTNALVIEGPDGPDGAGGTIRHLLQERTGARALTVGHPYRPPPASTREGVDEPVTPERWREALARVPSDERRRTLLRTFAWTSAVNAPALLGGEDEDLTRGYEDWVRLHHVAQGEEPPVPVLLDRSRGPQPYPLPLATCASQHMPDLFEAFRRAAAGVHDAGLLPRALLERLEREVERARGRVTSLEKERAGLPDPAALRATGDLLLARFGELSQGVDEATLAGFDGTPVTVPLDPTLTPDANARAYYDRATRAERAERRLPALARDARAAWQALDALLERARIGEATADQLRDALPREPGPRDGEGPTLPYRAYRSSGGLEIRVGRGARRNDELTFHHSAPDDIWLHARHAVGAHVILRWPRDGNPPARDLAEAAVLAALASKARTSGSVPVDWTRRKYVRKPRKAPPGSVVPERIETLFVKPDPALEERLRVD